MIKTIRFFLESRFHCVAIRVVYGSGYFINFIRDFHWYVHLITHVIANSFLVREERRERLLRYTEIGEWGLTSEEITLLYGACAVPKGMFSLAQNIDFGHFGLKDCTLVLNWVCCIEEVMLPHKKHISIAFNIVLKQS